MRKLIILVMLCGFCFSQTKISTQPGHSVVLTWTASPTSGVTYNVYRGSASGSETLLAATGSSAVTYTDTAIANGATYFYYVTALGTGGESVPSNEVSAQIPTPPSPPSNLSATIK